MQLDSFDLVASLQALPETDPIEIDGIQFCEDSGGDGGGGGTCQQACDNLSVNVINTVCAINATC